MADSTLAAIRKKVRRLTASPNEPQLTTADLDDYVDDFYDQDLPSHLKIWNLKDTYEFTTEANEDEYTFDKNLYHSIEGPIFIGGYPAQLYQDRWQFFGAWPFFESSNVSDTGTGISGPYTFTINSTPILKRNVLISAVDTNGDTLVVEDDGDGNLVDFVITPTSVNRGTINYLTGAVTVTFTNSIVNGGDITTRFRNYQASRPVSLLFFQDKMTVRPIPDGVYRVVVNVYKRPSQLLAAAGDTPDVNQWWQLIAFGTAIKVLQDRQDMESIQNIVPFFEEQKELVLYRTITQRSSERTSTIYAQQTEDQYHFSSGGS